MYPIRSVWLYMAMPSRPIAITLHTEYMASSLDVFTLAITGVIFIFRIHRILAL